LDELRSDYALFTRLAKSLGKTPFQTRKIDQAVLPYLEAQKPKEKEQGVNAIVGGLDKVFDSSFFLDDSPET
jgi:hypothetical protein